MREELTQERLKELLHYDSETGDFTWRVNRGAAREGDRAGCLGINGCWCIGVDGRLYRAHRLVWLYVHGHFPSGSIDHKNRDWRDNRIENLRIASREENMRNRGRFFNGAVGYKGVTIGGNDSTCIARITADGTCHYLGSFSCPREAARAYNKAAVELHGELAVLNPI